MHTLSESNMVYVKNKIIPAAGLDMYGDVFITNFFSAYPFLVSVIARIMELAGVYLR